MLRKDKRGSVSVEFAMVASLFLLPLFGGCTDVVQLISAQAQVNTALQSVYYFAYSNPALAANYVDVSDIVSKIAAHAVDQIAFPVTNTSGAANGAISYDCVSVGGGVTALPCSGGQTQRTFVSYQVTGVVSLLMPLTSLGFNQRLSASGRVQIAASVQ